MNRSLGIILIIAGAVNAYLDERLLHQKGKGNRSWALVSFGRQEAAGNLAAIFGRATALWRYYTYCY